jgi:alpha-L-rhamnosidase
MGDWCPPRWDRRSNPTAMECDPIISASAYFYDILKVMKGFAHITKDKEYETFLEKEIINLKEAFNQNYLVPIINTDAKWYGSQTATVMALQFDIVPQAEKVAVLNGLIYNINEINNGHHTTGIHGNRYLYTVLSKFGKPDLAYNVLTNPEFPSQAFVSNYGFTTWPERQWDWESGIELNNSLNHPMQSGFAAYFYEMLGGIKPVSKKPGFKEFAVNPIFPKNINHTVVSLMSPYGKISSKWKISGRDFEMKLTVPFNSKAILPLSASQQKTLQINDQNWATNQLGEIKKDSLVLGSGNYKITYQI